MVVASSSFFLVVPVVPLAVFQQTLPKFLSNKLSANTLFNNTYMR